MLFAIEIDNSQINFGLFENIDSELPKITFKIATDVNKTSDEYAVSINSILLYHGLKREDITETVIASVVPQLTQTLTMALKLLSDVNVMTVGKGTKTGFSIKIDNPADLGADLVANAAAVVDIKSRRKSKKAPCVIVDAGTATTIFALNANNEYIGGSIIPGVGISLDALHGRTALLPTVTPATPIKAIGKNSQESVRSGVVLGNVMMIDGFIDKFAEEMKCVEDVDVFLTGEYAETLFPVFSHNMQYFPHLTIMGIACIYRNNIKNQVR